MTATPLTVAVLGASGAVGNEMVRVLEQRDFPVRSLKLLATERSAGKVMRFKGSDVVVEAVDPNSFKGVELALF